MPLGSHVAVHVSAYVVAHTLCLAGADSRHRERHRQEQEPARLRRAFQMGWLGASGGWLRLSLSFNGFAMALVVLFTMVLVATTPRLPWWWTRPFLTWLLSSRPQREAHRCHSTLAMAWRQDNLGRSVRKPAKLAGLRPLRSAHMESTRAGEGREGP